MLRIDKGEEGLPDKISQPYNEKMAELNGYFVKTLTHKKKHLNWNNISVHQFTHF